MRHSAIAVSGPQTDSSIVQGGLRSPKAATEPNPYHRNLRSPGSLELGPIGGTPWVSVFPLTFPRNTRCDRTPWLDCEEKSATIGPAVCFEQACSGTRWLGRR